ncbi:MAG: type II secretion system protein [Pseudomonadota bacterium]
MPGDRDPRGRPQRGFTLVELLLVMVIAGILAAVAVPRLTQRSAFDVRGYADQLAATVRFAQKLAIAQRRDVFVQFSSGEAVLCYNAAAPCASPAPGPGGEKPYTVTAPGGVTITSAVSALGFDAGGRPNLAARLDIQVAGSGTHVVQVERETGYVH